MRTSAQDDASTAQQTFEDIVSRVHKLDEQTKKLDASIGVGARVRVDASLGVAWRSISLGRRTTLLSVNRVPERPTPIF
jgi:predicted NBD/HSP70 family sugar kinase